MRRQVQSARDSFSPPPPAASPSRSSTFATASHRDLFAEASGPRCDACNTALDGKDGEEHGTGVYVWARGGDVRREIVPLCPMCSNAIFAAAVGFLDYEDEE
jgi:hypothetical protein